MTRVSAGLVLAFAACRSVGREGAPQRAGEPSSAEPTNGETASEGDALVEEGPEPRPWIRGVSQTRVVGRTTDGESDVDLYETLALEFGDETSDRWSGRASGRFAWDVDGGSESDFFSLADSEGHDIDAQLYDAYATYRGDGAWERVRLGRQFVYDTPLGLWFDGIEARTKPRGAREWTTGVYGGVPARAYESSNGAWLAGLFEEVRPTRALRVRGDYLHVEDDSVTDGSNDLLGLGVFHDAGERLRWDARYSALDGESRDVTLGATWLDYERDLTLRATYTRLLEKQAALSPELDPFFETLFTLFPYDELRVSATKGFGEHVQLLAGFDVRRVRDESDVGAFNHDFERAFATLILERMLPGELTLALTGEGWNGEDADLRTWGADLSRRWDKKLDLGIGSFYALFKFDPFAGSEREDVRTYYAFARWRMSDAHSFQLRYEHEHQDDDDFDSLRWGTTWRF